jgi:hypothetical protein
MTEIDEMSRFCDGCGKAIDPRETAPVLDRSLATGGFLCPECANDAPFEFVECERCTRRFGLTDLAETDDEWDLADPFVCRDCQHKEHLADLKLLRKCCHCKEADGIHEFYFAIEYDESLPPADRWMCDACWNLPSHVERRQGSESRYKSWQQAALKAVEELYGGETSTPSIEQSEK